MHQKGLILSDIWQCDASEMTQRWNRGGQTDRQTDSQAADRQDK